MLSYYGDDYCGVFGVLIFVDGCCIGWYQCVEFFEYKSDGVFVEVYCDFVVIQIDIFDYVDVVVIDVFVVVVFDLYDFVVGSEGLVKLFDFFFVGWVQCGL